MWKGGVTTAETKVAINILSIVRIFVDAFIMSKV